MISNLLISLLQNRLFLLYTKFNNKCSGIPETFFICSGYRAFHDSKGGRTMEGSVDHSYLRICIHIIIPSPIV